VGSADPRRFKHRPHPDCKGEAVAGADHMGWLGLVQQPPAVKLAIANSQFFSDALLRRIVDRGLNRGSHNPLPGVGSRPQFGISDDDSAGACIDKIGVATMPRPPPIRMRCTADESAKLFTTTSSRTGREPLSWPVKLFVTSPTQPRP
jgi:hypothetical protein